MAPAAASVAAGREVIQAAVIVRFVAGDAEAFGEVFDRLHLSLFYVVRRFFRGAFDQEEAMQEVWLKLHRMRDRFDVNRAAQFVPWAKQVARNRCLDLLKERGRPVEMLLDEVEGRSDASQLSELASKRTRELLASFVSRLRPAEQEYFDLCFVHELPHEDIAARLGISVRRSKYLKKKLVARLQRSAPLRVITEE